MTKFPLSPTKREMANWIGSEAPVPYAYKLHQLKITVAEALYIMADVLELSYKYQERVVREMIRLQGGVL